MKKDATLYVTKNILRILKQAVQEFCMFSLQYVSKFTITNFIYKWKRKIFLHQSVAISCWNPLCAAALCLFFLCKISLQAKYLCKQNISASKCYYFNISKLFLLSKQDFIHLSLPNRYIWLFISWLIGLLFKYLLLLLSVIGLKVVWED